jgi:signal peptidase II
VSVLAARIYGAAVVITVLDQAFKALAVSSLFSKPNIVIIPGVFGESVGPVLQLTHVLNSGAAFGFGSNYTIVITVLAAFIIWMLIRYAKKITDPIWATAFALLLGGAIGNFLDRIFREPHGLKGHVIDYLQIPNFPVFNFADICISLAAVFIVLAVIKKRELDHKHV